MSECLCSLCCKQAHCLIQGSLIDHTDPQESIEPSTTAPIACLIQHSNSYQNQDTKHTPKTRYIQALRTQCATTPTPLISPPPLTSPCSLTVLDSSARSATLLFNGILSRSTGSALPAVALEDPACKEVSRAQESSQLLRSLL